MLNRRAMLASVGGLILGACSARATAIALPPLPGGDGAPLVGPHANYNGTADSGAGASYRTVLSRATQGYMPMAKWWLPSETWFYTNQKLGVAVDVNPLIDSIASVFYFGDCAETLVTQETLEIDTDLRGNPRARLGFWINLNAAAWQSKLQPGTLPLAPGEKYGTARIYALITTRQGKQRIIGGALPEPMTLYPATIRSDFDKTIGASADYTTIKAFLEAASAANPVRAWATFKTTGFYEMTNTSVGPFSNAKSRIVFTTSSNGVTATLGRSAPVGPYDPAHPELSTGHSLDMHWWVDSPGIEFRGNGNGTTVGGIIIDGKNMLGMRFSSPPHFNGCKLTNSRNNYSSSGFEYEHGPNEQFNIQQTGTGGFMSCYHTDDLVEHMEGATVGALMNTGMKILDFFGSPFKDNSFVENCILNKVGFPDASGLNFFAIGDMIRITGPAGATAAFYSPGGSASLGQMDLINSSGTTVFTRRFYSTSWEGYNQGDSLGHDFLVSQLAASINAFGNGWSATVTDDRMNAKQLCSGHGSSRPASANMTGSPVAFGGFVDQHGEWYQALQEDSNQLFRFNTTIKGVWSTGLINDARASDQMWRGNIWMGMNGTSPNQSAPGGSHVCIINNVGDTNMESGEYKYGADPYGCVSQNIFYKMGTDPLYHQPPTTDCIMSNPGNTGGHTGNVGVANLAAFYALFADPLNGDCRLVNSAAIANTKPKLSLSDSMASIRSSVDCVGAVSLAATAGSVAKALTYF